MKRIFSGHPLVL